MTNTRLTDITIRKLKQTNVQYEVHDCDVRGLAIRISPGGAKSFVVLYRMGHKSRKLTLGRYPSVSLAEARQRAKDALSQVSRGVDPANVKRLIRKNYANSLFAHFVDDYVENHAKPNTRAWKETNRLLRREFISGWAKVPLDQITRSDILSVLDNIMSRSPSTANHAFAAIRGLFNWCVSRGYIEHSPCVGMKMPSKAKSRDRVLSDAELVRIWKASQQMGYPFGTIVQLLMATAQRRNEVTQIAWADLDLANRIWTQPSSKNKSGRKHLVALSSMALEVLQNVPKMHDDLVFPARGKDRPASGFSKWKAKMDELSRVSDWTLHDIRRTVATKMASLNVPIHITELILNHSSTKLSGVAGVYNRHEYLEERREALDRWAQHLDSLLQRNQSSS